MIRRHGIAGLVRAEAEKHAMHPDIATRLIPEACGNVVRIIGSRRQVGVVFPHLAFCELEMVCVPVNRSDAGQIRADAPKWMPRPAINDGNAVAGVGEVQRQAKIVVRPALPEAALRHIDVHVRAASVRRHPVVLVQIVPVGPVQLRRLPEGRPRVAGRVVVAPAVAFFILNELLRHRRVGVAIILACVLCESVRAIRDKTVERDHMVGVGGQEPPTEISAESIIARSCHFACVVISVDFVSYRAVSIAIRPAPRCAGHRHGNHKCRVYGVPALILDMVRDVNHVGLVDHVRNEGRPLEECDRQKNRANPRMH